MERITLSQVPRYSFYVKRSLQAIDYGADDARMLAMLEERTKAPVTREMMVERLAGCETGEFLADAMRRLRRDVMIALIARDTTGLADFEEVVRTMSDLAEVTVSAAALLGCAAEDLSDRAAYCWRVQDWLLGSHAPRQNGVDHFLAELDEFDLNEYIRSIRFNELKVPTAPFQLPTSRSYFGLQQMMESELDFMKAAVLSRSMEPVIMYSDMPMEQMAKDPDFPKKWMFGMAMMLNKGLCL